CPSSWRRACAGCRGSAGCCEPDGGGTDSGLRSVADLHLADRGDTDGREGDLDEPLDPVDALGVGDVESGGDAAADERGDDADSDRPEDADALAPRDDEPAEDTDHDADDDRADDA